MKLITSIRRLILRNARERSSFLADCIAGWKMYIHTKTYHRKDQEAFAKAFYDGGYPRVLGGPFKGMLYENRTYFGPVTPRWIGCYEKELHGIIRAIADFHPECVVDIGAAEGYYSTGLAKMFPAVKVFSYETNPLSIWQQHSLKRLNKTNNLKIGYYCTRDKLREFGSRRSFILSDIEGCEFDLFTADVTAALSNSMVLIELHSYKGKSVDEVALTLQQRFSTTHDIHYIRPQLRTPADIEVGLPPGFDDGMIVSAMDEFRSQKQAWMHCIPNSFK